jgi:hypothetical protein
VSRQEQGCRAGRKPIDERLAAKDQARRELRTEQMRDAKGWKS